MDHASHMIPVRNRYGRRGPGRITVDAENIRIENSESGEAITVRTEDLVRLLDDPQLRFLLRFGAELSPHG